MAPNRIDVHHHYIPEFYKQAIIKSGGDPSGWHIPEWTPETDEKVNQIYGISTTMLSLTTPGALILKDPQECANLARQANEYAAKMRDDNPKKYGFLASLPNLLDKELASKELAYAFDVLKADGVLLFTRYGMGNHYLGHPDFNDIWAELNRRSAVVLVHPTPSVDTSQVSNLPQPIIRYPMETTTTAMDMLVNKTMRNNPNCKVILSHGGGTLPFLIGRPASILPKSEKELEEFWEDARNFYFDVAVAGTENSLVVLEKFAKPGHILYGSDTPYATDHIINFHTSRLDKYEFKHPDMINQINNKNALELFPRLKEEAGNLV
ncbi:amidohydrolase 2 [Astrocystis sublimbata]|nr:amidohydrolase 2 [Astrocystis sublimbata]